MPQQTPNMHIIVTKREPAIIPAISAVLTPPVELPVVSMKQTIISN